MKRCTLFSLIFLIAISICFFSSPVIAGDGTDGRSDTHPWDLDGITIDSLTGDGLFSRIVEPNVGGSINSMITFSLSNSFSIWFYSKDLLIMEKGECKTTKSSSIFRGKISRSF